MKLFGTDGLRGHAGEFPLDTASVRRLGRELGARLARRASGGSRVVLGGDTRESTPRIVADLAAGLSDSRCGVAPAGVITTPGVAELVLEIGASAGVAVSASHNPYQDNGIKIFGPDGRKWPDEEEELLERALLEPRDGDLGPTPPPPDPDPGLVAAYVSRLRASVPENLASLSVVVDAGHGAAYQIGPLALSRAGAAVKAIHAAPDGRNINSECGALHPGAMARETRASGAAIGVAFDGDADRSIFADESGRVLDGDDVMWIVARDWKRRGRLTAGGVVGTVMSNYGLEAALGREGIAFHRAAVGDRNVARLMDETGAVLGGETSGHVLLAPLSPAGDGILTALVLSEILRREGRPLSTLATLEKMPQTLRNIRVAKRVPVAEIESVRDATARGEQALRSRGRIFLRYSGTEPLLRILVEGPDAIEVHAIADEIEAAARTALT
jgi:phosphoglucosamine mutase